jgi:hypothetical protein
MRSYIKGNTKFHVETRRPICVIPTCLLSKVMSYVFYLQITLVYQLLCFASSFLFQQNFHFNCLTNTNIRIRFWKTLVSYLTHNIVTSHVLLGYNWLSEARPLWTPVAQYLHPSREDRDSYWPFKCPLCCCDHVEFANGASRLAVSFVKTLSFISLFVFLQVGQQWNITIDSLNISRALKYIITIIV